MTDLKSCFEEHGYADVITYIASGNVIFTSEKNDIETLTKDIESMLSKRFDYKATVVIRSEIEIRKTVTGAPSDWDKRKDIRKNVMFLRDGIDEESVMVEIKPKDGVDEMYKGTGAVYLSTLLAKRTKSALPKIVSKKIYKDMTIRTYGTVKKILELMNHHE